MKNYFTAVLFLASFGIHAQETPQNKPTFPLWTAPLPNAQGSYAVSLNSICSVALEKYDLKFDDKVFPITECSIETVGGKTARFYFVDEDKREKKDGPVEQAKDAIASVVPGMEENSEKDQKKLRVVKIYPESALAGTVEYRLSSEKKVTDLYQNLRDAWVASAP
jgi:hypothetical protein